MWMRKAEENPALDRLFGLVRGLEYRFDASITSSLGYASRVKSGVTFDVPHENLHLSQSSSTKIGCGPSLSRHSMVIYHTFCLVYHIRP
jgi:hypothetical protein